MKPLDVVVFGLSITSSWGNGHATTYRALLRALAERGHRLLFVERDRPWYASHRDLPAPPYCEVALYQTLDELSRFAARVAAADLVLVGSFVPDGPRVIDWVLAQAHGKVAFYDVDTPVTLRKLAAGDEEYLARAQVPRFDLYLSFTGGPTLRRLETEMGARKARALYCSCDPDAHRPLGDSATPRWDLGYLGTYSDDRQPTVERLLVDVARRLPERRFVIAGPLYPAQLRFPDNVDRIDHVAPPEHAAFYGAQRFTLNVTRTDMVALGHSPSVRLFEAAACGVPVISDVWPGFEEALTPGAEAMLARTTDDVEAILMRTGERERRAVGQAARRRVLGEHTAAHRAASLEHHLLGL